MQHAQPFNYARSCATNSTLSAVTLFATSQGTNPTYDNILLTQTYFNCDQYKDNFPPTSQDRNRSYLTNCAGLWIDDSNHLHAQACQFYDNYHNDFNIHFDSQIDLNACHSTITMGRFSGQLFCGADIAPDKYSVLNNVGQDIWYGGHIDLYDGDRFIYS